jgi:hypothetical protein
MYTSIRVGDWMTVPYNIVNFRKDVALMTGEPAQALSIPEKVILESKLGQRPYCLKANKSSLKTKARILIFQRSATRSLRKFDNLGEVINLAQSYSTVPVSVVTVNTTTSLADQIRLFNNFDILITPHGSHLVNGIFTVNPGDKAVIEVDPFVFEKVFFSNYYHRLRFGNYVFSSGHLTSIENFYDSRYQCPFIKQSDFSTKKCFWEKTNLTMQYSPLWLNCPDEFQTRGCNTIVNITLLKAHMDEMFLKSLCPPASVK